MHVDRRTFLFGSVAAAVAGRAMPQPATGLETLSEWLRAPAASRVRGLQPLLDRIRAMDPSIHAWVQVAPQRPTGPGALADIPFGVKDIIETKGLSTEYGSPIYKGRIGTEDAAIVRELRARGGVLLGKTHSTAFAYRTPAPTRNPRALDHTPGGSSSGSAAAVAAGMVPPAIGSPTAGPLLPPPADFGLVGFKTPHGPVSHTRARPPAPSFDHLGAPSPPG